MISKIYNSAFSVLLQKPFRLWGISLLSGLLGFAASILFGIIPGVLIGITLLLSTSMTMVYLHGYRGEEVHAYQLFDSCKDWNTVKRVLGGMGWMALWIFLWGLIPIVGPIFAIIRMYEYRLTPYILVQEPNVPVTEAIQASKKCTNGYKAKMFWADIIPFLLYAAACLFLSIFGLIPFIGILFRLISFLLFIAWTILSPLFLGLVKAAFYEEITADLSQTQSNP